MFRCRSLVFVCLFLAGCAGTRPGGRAPEATTIAAPSDSAAFVRTLEAHAALPATERAAARRTAEEAAAPWREFESEARQDFDSNFRHWYYRDNPVPAGHRGWGLPNAIVTLHRATELDPSFAEAWGALGHLTAAAGDASAALRNLDAARIAARAEADAGRPLPPDLQLRIFRDRAWALRDLGRWDAGLAAVAEGLAFRPRDPELVLVQGLLLADAGRYAEATSLAAGMPALTYPRYDFTYRGFKRQTSAYANNWIRAEALLVRGQTEDAYHALGDLDLYAYRGLLPFADRYWRDAGLIAELRGDPKAPIYYAVGYLNRPYQHYLPVAPLNVGSMVLDVPNPQVPVYLGFGMRTWVAGSPLVYVGAQINRMAMADDEAERLQAGGRALRMLDVLEKRGVRPDVCRALRGRVYYVGGDYDLARTELETARSGFGERNRVDPGTSLLLGLIYLRDERCPDAGIVLDEAVTADRGSALGWRSLGVALSKTDRPEEADRAMSRALELDPVSVSGWYNRGLLRLQRQRFALAVADLDQALRLDPENREVQRLLQMAAAGNRAAGGDAVTVSQGPPPGFVADPDSLTAALTAQLAVALTPPDSLREGSLAADRRFRALEATYLTEPTLERRRVLARAYLDRNLLDSLQALLAPGWGKDLDPAEELMLLWADRNLGEKARADEAARELVAAGPGTGNGWTMLMAAESMRTSVDPAGTDMAAPNTHGFFHWLDHASASRANILEDAARQVAGYAASLYAQYGGDPLFENAVWGMTGRSNARGGFSVGGTGPK